MKLAWDPRKSERTLVERGFDFEFAARVLRGVVLQRPDLRRDYGEDRVVVVGRVDDLVLTVVVAFRRPWARDQPARIVSARLSNRRERAALEAIGGEGPQGSRWTRGPLTPRLHR